MIDMARIPVPSSGGKFLLDDTCWNTTSTLSDILGRMYSRTSKKNDFLNFFFHLAYRMSKAMAEREAWNFLEKHNFPFEFASINPFIVFGPLYPLTLKQMDQEASNQVNIGNTRGEKLRGSMLIYANLFSGKQQAAANTISLCDVRDVALAHVKALTVKNVNKQRIIIGNECTTMQRIVKEMKAVRPEQCKAQVKEEMQNIEPVIKLDQSKSVELLQLQYTAAEKTIADTADSLIELGYL